MTRLPTSLSIAFWLVGSVWLVAIVVYVFGAPQQIVHATLAFGAIAGIVEWLARRRNSR